MLPTGTRLGPYKVLDLIGEGGMGQVYRAADTRLDRTVAIKVLPADLAADQVRRERFEREARSISRLEHPNICPLYDVGELPAGTDGSPSTGLFLVMQFLEGETLAQRIERGPLSIKETLDLSIQIAGALAAAHRAGIVHRDLKPGNVMLTRSGARLLDFGLARDLPGTTGGDATRTSLTTQGTLLGTLHYMAPEQLEGREADTRSDVFAFGALLFEMVTGLRAFDAESPARVMSAILRDEPTRVSSVVPVTPAGLDDLIHTCLAKDPQERWQGMADVARQLRWLQSSLSAGRTGAVAVSPVAPAGRKRVGAAAAAIVAVVIGAWVLSWALAEPSSGTAIRLHASLLPPEGNYLTGGLALSPDATRLVFVAADVNGERQLWLRALDAPRAQPLGGTTGASDPFWSPAGDEIAFFANNQLKRVAASGGAATVISDAGAGAGGTWSSSGSIVFQPHQQGPLMRVDAAGGRPEPATTFEGASANDTHHLYPSFLPDGRHFVYYVAGAERGLYVGVAGESERAFLFDPDPSLPSGAAATPGVYAEGGHLIYVRDRVLMARPFDAGSRSVTGDAVKVADTVDYSPPGQAAFATAGPLVIYRPRQHLPQATLTWIDRSGHEGASVSVPPGAFRNMSMTADGRVLAIDRNDAQGVSSVWTVELDRGPSARIPAAYWSGAPVWSPDGRQLAYSIAADSPPNLVVRADGGTGAERRLTTASAIHYAMGWTPDSRTILYSAFSTDTGWDLFTVAADGSGPPQRLLQTAASENDASVSPDGRLLLYTSDDSGVREVYLSQFPEVASRHAVSSGGGLRPKWRRDGREIFFLTRDGRMMAVPVTSAAGAPPATGAPTPLFQAAIFGNMYVPAADGRRFLIAKPALATETVPMELLLLPLGQ